jgi:DNA-binding MarR family transcriptional regulator
MNEPAEFTSVVRAWAEVFMRHEMREFIRLSKSTGLSMGQIGTLMRLYHHGVCGVSDLGEYLGVTNAASSQMIHKLVEQGLLERSEDPADRRNKLISLSPSGKKLVHDIIAARHTWMESLASHLNSEDQQTIIFALTSLTQAARRLDALADARPITAPGAEHK